MYLAPFLLESRKTFVIFSLTRLGGIDAWKQTKKREQVDEIGKFIPHEHIELCYCTFFLQFLESRAGLFARVEYSYQYCFRDFFRFWWALVNIIRVKERNVNFKTKVEVFLSDTFIFSIFSISPNFEWDSLVFPFDFE